MDYLNYVNSQIDKLNKKHQEYQNAYDEVKKAADARVKNVGGYQLSISDEARTKNQENANEFISKLKEEYSSEVDKIVTETEETLAAGKKKAIQDYAAAEPVPTDEQLRKVDQIRQQYTNGTVFDSMRFNADFDFHVNNETVNAYPYYLLAVERSKQERPNPATDQRLQNVYMKLFPELQKASDDFTAVDNALKQFRISNILFKFSTDDSISFNDSVRMKNELNDLGYYGSQNQMQAQGSVSGL